MSNYIDKPYKCLDCGATKQININHYEEVFSFCHECGDRTNWKYTGDLPESYEAPTLWKCAETEKK